MRLAVRLTPRGGRDGVIGVTACPDGRAALGLRVSAPPVDGEANAALIALLAKSLRLRKGDIAIASGETGRVKIVQLTGDGPMIVAHLEAWIAQS